MATDSDQNSLTLAYQHVKRVRERERERLTDDIRCRQSTFSSDGQMRSHRLDSPGE